MSKYTTEVRYICENAAGLTDSVGFDSIDDVLTPETVAKVFKGIEYPIFDEEYRYLLNKKILLTYYTREICAETVGLWKLQMRQVLNNIMPFYNQLYESEKFTFNPFHDKDITKTGRRQTDGNTATSGGRDTVGSNSANNSERYSDTPQGTLSNIETNTYLTNATLTSGSADSTENVTSRENSNAHSLEDYTERIVGKDNANTYSSLLKEFRETFLNIDKMIIEELKPCFFGLW